MCGIAGIFSREGLSSSSIDWVNQMNGVLKHRGPDDEGTFADEFCVLGHRRLSIIDLSNDGHQPFASDDGRFELVYNGEIYNYIELRSDLEKLGWKFRTKTDTEVLLKAYQQYGKDCLGKLNGMFAFAIYDSRECSLFLCRDRVGIKPLYYTVIDSTLYFASEIKALFVLPFLKPSINYLSLFDYLVFNRTDVFDETFFCDVKRIGKGCYAVVDMNGLRMKVWWSPEDYVQNQMEDLDREEISKKVHDILFSSVQLRLRSDVPVGSCLSGGLDSSILVGILFSHELVGKGYPTFTASFGDHPIDEIRYVNQLNEKYSFQNFRTYPTAEHAYHALKKFVYVNDEPTTNPSFFSQYEVMKLAKEKGVTVLLDGQGGDENFAGYQYFHGFNQYGLLKNGQMLSFCSELWKSFLRKQHKSAFETLLFQILPNSLKKKALLRTVPYIHPDFFYSYVDNSLIFNEFFDVTDLNHSLARHFEFKLEHLLRMEDRNSMAFSIEARVPYLDYRLIEYLLRVPGKHKITSGETKYLQKVALGKYTVPEILNRKDKIGFGTPGDEWMKSDNWQVLTEQSYQDLAGTYPEVFRKESRLPLKGFSRWKINQLRTWKDLFLQ